MCSSYLLFSAAAADSFVADVAGLDLDLIAAEAARGETRSRVSTNDGIEGGSEGEDADPASGDDPPPRVYPARPERRVPLADLLRAAGYEAAAEAAPRMEILNIVTCNSASAGEGSLYVCVPGEDGEDGHDWADEAAELGAVAVLAQRPLPGCLLPVVVVDNTLRALGRVAAEFYGALVRTVSCYPCSDLTF